MTELVMPPSRSRPEPSLLVPLMLAYDSLNWSTSALELALRNPHGPAEGSGLKRPLWWAMECSTVTRSVSSMTMPLPLGRFLSFIPLFSYASHARDVDVGVGVRRAGLLERADQVDAAVAVVVGLHVGDADVAVTRLADAALEEHADPLEAADLDALDAGVLVLAVVGERSR